MKSRLLFILILLLIPSSVFARSRYRKLVPNNTDYFGRCGVCHSPDGSHFANNIRAYNAFSRDFSRNGGRWSRIFNLDSDGDGYTNGEELGDPLGSWTGSFPLNNTKPSSPSDPNETPCGNGLIDGPEECDGTNLGQKTCTDFGAMGEGLSCSNACKFDKSGCEEKKVVPPEEKKEAVCGNGLIEEGEDCEGKALAGNTCADLGKSGTGLSCSPQCQYVTETCKTQNTDNVDSKTEASNTEKGTEKEGNDIENEIEDKDDQEKEDSIVILNQGKDSASSEACDTTKGRTSVIILVIFFLVSLGRRRQRLPS